MRAISSITSISRVTSRKRVVRHAHVDRALPGARIEAEAVEDLDRARQRHLERRDVRDALHAHAQLRARRQVAADVDRARRHVRRRRARTSSRAAAREATGARWASTPFSQRLEPRSAGRAPATCAGSGRA